MIIRKNVRVLTQETKQTVTRDILGNVLAYVTMYHCSRYLVALFYCTGAGAFLLKDKLLRPSHAVVRTARLADR
jgi:hypothetical protein